MLEFLFGMKTCYYLIVLNIVLNILFQCFTEAFITVSTAKGSCYKGTFLDKSNTTISVTEAKTCNCALNF